MAEFELMSEVAQVPKRKLPAPKGLGEPEAVSHHRLVGFSYPPQGKVELLVIGMDATRLAQPLQKLRMPDFRTRFLEVTEWTTPPERFVRHKLGVSLCGTDLVVVLASVDSPSEARALLSASKVIRETVSSATCSLLLVLDKGPRNVDLWPPVSALSGAHASLALPPVLAQQAVEATTRSEEPGRLWTLVHQQSWGLMRQFPHSR